MSAGKTAATNAIRNSFRGMDPSLDGTPPDNAAGRRSVPCFHECQHVWLTDLPAGRTILPNLSGEHFFVNMDRSVRLAPTTGQYKIRLVTKVGINHFMTLLPVLPVFSNAQAGKGLRRAAHVIFPLELLQLEDSALAEKSARFNCFEAIVWWLFLLRSPASLVRNAPSRYMGLMGRMGPMGLMTGCIRRPRKSCGGVRESGNARQTRLFSARRPFPAESHGIQHSPRTR